MVREGFIDVSLIMQSGVYLLLWRGEVVYVGQSVRLSSRLGTHVAQKGKMRKSITSKKLPAIRFDGIEIMPCMISDLDRIEREMIDKFQPKYNINHKPKPTMSLEMLIDLMPTPVLTLSTQPMVRPNASWRRL